LRDRRIGIGTIIDVGAVSGVGTVTSIGAVIGTGTVTGTTRG